MRDFLNIVVTLAIGSKRLLVGLEGGQQDSEGSLSAVGLGGVSIWESS